MQYFYQCLESKALSDDKEIPPLDEEIKKYLIPNKELFEANKYASFMPKLFVIKEKAKKDEIESISKRVAEMTEHVNALQSQYDKESMEVDGKIEEINKRIEIIDEEIASIKGDSVSDDYFNKLYNIAKKKGGVGLVPVYGQVCMGCNTVLPMQFVIDLRLKQFNGENMVIENVINYELCAANDMCDYDM